MPRPLHPGERGSINREQPLGWGDSEPLVADLHSAKQPVRLALDLRRGTKRNSDRGMDHEILGGGSLQRRQPGPRVRRHANLLQTLLRPDHVDVSKRWGQPAVALQAEGFLFRTPAPPPFSGMNCMPAFSKALCIALRLFTMGVLAPDSNALTVDSPTEAASASCF